MAAEVSEVLVLGAGMAGLAAAKRLHARGLRVQVLEARSRIGGRIWSRPREEGPPLELGAEWIHGEAQSLLSLSELAELGVKRYATQHFLAGPGGLRPYTSLLEAGSDRLAAPTDEDISVAERARREGWSRAEWEAVLRVIEGFDAADPTEASALACSHEAEAISGEGSSKPAQGYAALCAFLAEGLSIQLDEVVQDVRWKQGLVEVEGKRRYRAEALILSVPLGVLQAEPPALGALRFQPALPEKQVAAAGLRMGQALKVLASFHEALPLPSPAFLHCPGQPLPLWWSAGPRGARDWVGWAGGRAAQGVALAPKEAARASLAALLGKKGTAWAAEQLEALECWDWQADPFSRGAYAYLPVGGYAAQRTLAAPVAGTLFFAGEATSRDGFGTVQGALESGWRAADELLRCRS